MELIPAAGTLAPVVVALPLLEEFAGGQETHGRGLVTLGYLDSCFLDGGFAGLDGAIWDGCLAELDFGSVDGDAEEEEEDGGEEAHFDCWRDE